VPVVGPQQGPAWATTDAISSKHLQGAGRFPCRQPAADILCKDMIFAGILLFVAATTWGMMAACLRASSSLNRPSLLLSRRVNV